MHRDFKPIIITVLVCMGLLLLLMLMSPMVSADWYTGGEYRAPDYWYYADHLMHEGEYTLAEMAAQHEANPPSVIRFVAESIEDADRQLEAAMLYAPETVVIQFTKTADARRYHELYRDWRDTGTPIDAVIGAVWTRTGDVIFAGRSGTSVILTIPRYSNGWLAFVDTTDEIRIYDPEYSAKLKWFRETWIDTITGTDEEKLTQIRDLVSGYAVYDTDEHARMQANGFCVVDEDAHTVRGVAEKRKAVCDGFTNALQFALACHNIKVFDVILWSEEGSHSVAQVKIGGEWVRVDATDGEARSDYSELMWIRSIYNG